MISSILKQLIWLYKRTVSPWLGNRCRFVPSCSDYANQAIDLHGATKGSWLTAKRLCRCHPWGGEGLDPVPGTEQQYKT